MIETLEIKIKLELKDFLNFQFDVLKKKYLLSFILICIFFIVILLIPIISLFSFGSATLSSIPFSSYIYPIVFLVIWPAFTIGILYSNSKKRFKDSSLLQNIQEYTFTKEGILIINKNATAQFKWVELYKYNETKSNLLIYITPNTAYILPKRLLTNNETDSLKTMLQNNIVSKEKKKLLIKRRLILYSIFIVVAGLITFRNLNVNNASDLYFNSGYEKEKNEDYKGAIIEFDKAIKESPEFAKAYNHRGYSKGMIGNYTEELEDCSKAIDLDKYYGNAYYNRAEAKNALNDLTGACIDYKKAFEMGYKKANAALEKYCK